MHAPTAVHVARGTSYIILQNLTTSAAMVVSFAVLARLITPADMGTLAALTLVTGLCQTLATVALPQAATRFIAEELAHGSRQAAASVFYQAVRATLLFAAPFSLATFLGANFLSVQLLGEQKYAIFFQVLAVDIILYAGVLPVLTASVLGLQKFRESALFGILNTLIRQTSIILLVIALRGFLGLVVAWVAADVVSASVYMIYVLGALGRPRFDFPFRRLLGFSWPLCLGNAVSFASAWFDRALLLIFVPLATLGVYNATVIAFGVLAGIANATATTLFPTYSAIQSSNQRENLTGAIRLSTRYVSFVVIPLALGLVATAKPALTLFVGPAYVEGSTPLMIMSGVFAFTVIGTALTPSLLALAETRLASAITITSVGVSVVVALILLPSLGMVGTAAARGCAMILTTALTILILRRKLRLQLDLEAAWKSLIAGIVMALVVLAVQVVFYNRFLLPLYALVGGLTYFAMLRLLRAIKPSDAQLVREYLGPRFQFLVDRLESFLVKEEVRG